MSHTLLSLIDSETGQPFSDSRKRLAIFAKMLRSGVPESWLRQSHLSQQLPHVPLKNVDVAGIINLNYPFLMLRSFLSESAKFISLIIEQNY